MGHLAFTANVELHELSLEKFDLEQLFFSLTRGAYAAPGSAPTGPPPGSAPAPGYQQPGYQQPGYQQPGYQQPGYQQPGHPPPGYQPGYQPQPPSGGGQQ